MVGEVPAAGRMLGSRDGHDERKGDAQGKTDGGQCGRRLAWWRARSRSERRMASGPRPPSAARNPIAEGLR